MGNCGEIYSGGGAGAGLATFGTPISGVFLAIELFTFEFRVKSLVPIAIASAIGGWMHIMLITPKPLFSTPGYAFGGLNILPFYALLGACAGVNRCCHNTWINFSQRPDSRTKAEDRGRHHRRGRMATHLPQKKKRRQDRQRRLRLGSDGMFFRDRGVIVLTKCLRECHRRYIPDHENREFR
jgi:hypothetical protein